MTDNVFKISLPGYDVKTATPDQCSIDSRYEIHKVAPNSNSWTYDHTHITATSFSNNGSNHGKIDFTFQNITYPSGGPGSWSLFTLNHGLGYTPISICYSTFNPSEQSILPTSLTGVGAGPTLYYSADDTYIYIKLSYSEYSDTSINGWSGSIKYYIFVENGA